LKETQRQEKHKKAIEVRKAITESHETSGKSTGVDKASRPSNFTITPIDKKIMDLEQKKLPEKAAWSKKINAKISKEQKRLKRLREKEGGGFKRDNKDSISDNDETGRRDHNSNNDDDDDDEGETDWKELVMEKKNLKKIKLENEQPKLVDSGLQQSTPAAATYHSHGFDKNLGEFFLGLAG
jgi:hypothetical protein